MIFIEKNGILNSSIPLSFCQIKANAILLLKLHLNIQRKTHKSNLYAVYSCNFYRRLTLRRENLGTKENSGKYNDCGEKHR